MLSKSTIYSYSIKLAAFVLTVLLAYGAYQLMKLDRFVAYGLIAFVILLLISVWAKPTNDFYEHD